MITKDEYHKLKAEIKLLSKPEIKKLCEDMELTDYEKSLLMSSYNGESVVKICMEHYISNYTYNIDIKTIYTKIKNYLNFSHK